jgi:AbrB family looped-hinge helix DNA binding protein
MSYFTKRNNNSSSYQFISKIDEKGRITIPSTIRRTFGIMKGEPIEIELSLVKQEITFKISRIFERREDDD